MTKPDCFACAHRGATLANIYCNAVGLPVDPSSVTECYRFTPERKTPMKVRYNLSKKQKAAIEAGEPLRLAVPNVRGEFVDERHAIVDAPARSKIFSDRVWCSLLNRGGGGPDSLQSYMGEIVDTQNTHLMPCYELPVIIVSINGGKAPTRWPAGPVVLEEVQ